MLRDHTLPQFSTVTPTLPTHIQCYGMRQEQGQGATTVDQQLVKNTNPALSHFALFVLAPAAVGLLLPLFFACRYTRPLASPLAKIMRQHHHEALKHMDNNPPASQPFPLM